MAKLKNYTGNTELGAGLCAKNNGDFPLMEANSVQVDETGKRLDEELQLIKDSIINKEDGGVGKETSDGGEIFNDYNNNTASEYAHAEGYNTLSGCKAFTILDMNETDEEVNGIPGKSFKLDSVKGLVVDDVYSTHIYYGDDVSRQRFDYGKITNIDSTNKIVTVDKIPTKEDCNVDASRNFVPMNDGDWMNTNIDGEENTFRIVAKPTTGTRNIGYATHAEGHLSEAHSKGAHAEGRYTIAYGSYAHAEGRGTKASYNAHAEGKNSHAIGITSHAEGNGSKAIGESAHAEGDDTTASGNQSHAEGNGSTASGNQSHAEGVSTTASGEAAHAEGNGSEAKNKYAHAEGNSTTASGEAAHAEGNGSTASGNQSHAEGNSTTASNKAAHAEGDGTTASGFQSHAEGNGSTASGNQSHAEGVSTTASGKYAHAEGSSTIAEGTASHAQGLRTKASGKAAHAEGENTLATGDHQHVQGKFNKADKEKAHIVGGGTSDEDRKNIHTIDWEGNGWFAGTVKVGGTKQNDAKEVATKEYVDNVNAKVTEIIDAAPEALNTLKELSNAIDNDANFASTVIKKIDAKPGRVTESNGEVFNDYENNTAAVYSHAEGLRNTAGTMAFNILDMNETDKTFTLDSVEGLEVGDVYSTHTHYESTKEGYTGIENSISRQRLNFGKITNINVENKVVTVDNIFVLIQEDIDKGYEFTAVEDPSVFIYDGIDSEENTFRIMLKPHCGTRLIGNGVHTEGFDSSAQSKGAHSEGRSTIAYGSYAHTEGWMTRAGYCAHAEGKNTQAIDECAHSEGRNSVASAHEAHAEGNSTKASASQAHAEGSKTTASGAQAHAEGASTTASGKGAHAEGNGTQATGAYAHTEGSNTKASGTASHAEGNGSIAEGPYAHAEGSGTTASGQSAHAEGNVTVASGKFAHAEGNRNTASGEASHAEGLGTIATHTAQHVQGRANIVDTAKTYAHIVGNGTVVLNEAKTAIDEEKTERKNIHTLDWSGNGWFAGQLKVGGSGQDDGDEVITNKKLKEALDDIAKDDIGYMRYTEIDDNANYEDIFEKNAWLCYYDGADQNYSHYYENAPFESALILTMLRIYEREDGSSSNIVQYAFGLEGIKKRCVSINESNWHMGDNSWYDVPNVGKETDTGGEIFNDYFSNIAGYRAHAEGIKTKAYGDAAHTEGQGTIAASHYQHVQGKYNIEDSSNKYAHIVGNGNSDTNRKNIHTLDWSGNGWFKGNIKVGGTSYDDAKEIATKDYVDNSGVGRAIGGGEIFNDYTNNTAVGGAHAEGLNTHAEGAQAHSEGSNTYATGNQSHAECLRTTASGTASHAEGNRSKATAEGAHAEGKCTQASGKYSHSEGEGTVAKGQYQHVQGIANEIDNTGKYAHIIGGGKPIYTNNELNEELTSRKNIHTLDWSGNAWYAGSVEATSIILKSSTEGSNKRFKLTINDDGELSVTEI